MKYRLALDEPRDYDKRIEVRGLTFILDPFAASLIEELMIDYDDYEEQFIVINSSGPTSAC